MVSPTARRREGARSAGASARTGLLGVVALLAGLGAAASPAAACDMAPADRAWLEAALERSQAAEARFLLLAPRPLPTIVAIDGQCTYVLAEPGATDPFARVDAAPHDGVAVLPDGSEVPLGPVSFASGRAGGFFAMSLPSVWRAAGVTSELGVERLMDGVLLHELMHSRQTQLADRVLAPLAASGGIAEEALTDDIVQQRFGGDAAYSQAWSEERDLLFQAAAAPDEAQARVLAGQALAQMRARRARWFTGDSTVFAALDDVFLTMEGIGQWLAYRSLLSPEGGGLAPDMALPAVRRGGRQWSQDEGLALMLVVDRLLPGWQQRAFADPDWRAERLLSAALERRPS